MAALLALGVAAVSIARFLREEFKDSLASAQPAAPPPAKQEPAAPDVELEAADDPDMVRSRLAVVRVGKGEEARSVAMLGRPARTMDYERGAKWVTAGLLGPELFRQAVLIAARDELGGATRDEVLGEATSASKDNDVEVITIIRGDGRTRIAIRRASGDKKPLFDQSFAAEVYAQFIETAESWSRNEVPAVLKALDLDGSPNPRRDEGGVPGAANESLAHLGLSDQFAAIRDLHAAIRRDGESPSRLAALARAYAVLGMLTEFQWHPAHKVYKARALLYAQRLVARDPNAALGLWTRAFVKALVGLHHEAQDDLRQVRGLAKANGDPPSAAPPWSGLIDPFLRYDTRQIKAEVQSLESLAALLRLVSVEFPHLKTRSMPAAKELLAREPACFRAIDVICNVGGLGDLHVATVLGPQTLDEVVPRKLLALRTIPAPVREAIERQLGEPRLVEALDRAGEPGNDPGEPSWGALGHLIEETRFVHVARRLSFMRNTWAVSVQQYWDESHLSVARHRFRPYLESMTLPPAEANQVLADFFEKIDVTDLELPARPITSLAEKLPGPGNDHPWRAALHNVDNLARDMELALANVARQEPYARHMVEFGWHSPYARSVLIEKNWDAAKAHIDEWRNDPATGDSPVILGAIGKRYTALGRIDDAQTVLRQYVKQSPEKWAYEMLADNEKARGDMTRWREFLEEFLERTENSGLDHTLVQVQIAQSLMDLAQWGKAQPYAEAAAQTWAGWAMDCAGRCNEGMGEFGRAEFWFRNEAERYPRSFVQWFDFCIRSMHGDLDAAARLAKRYIEQQGDSLTENEKGLAVTFFEEADDPAGGLAFLVPLLEVPSPGPRGRGNRYSRWIELLFLARFADSLNKTAIRDEYWAKLATADRPDAARAVAIFHETIDAKGSKPFDAKAFDTLLASTDGITRSYLCYFAGHFLKQRGDVEKALHYWEQCANGIEGGGQIIPRLATTALRRLLDGKIPDDSHLYCLRGRFHRMEDRLDLALEDFDRAIALDPKNREAINLRGVVKRASGDLDGSAADFTRAIELAPDEPSYRFGRAITRVLQGQDDAALEDIQRGVAAAPESGFGLASKGLLDLAQGRKADAEVQFEQALAHDRSLGTSLERLKKAVERQRVPDETEETRRRNPVVPSHPDAGASVERGE